MKIDKNHMTEEQLWNLRKEVVAGSLYYSDYENSYDIDTKICCDFFDGYLDYLGELMEEAGIADEDFWEKIDAFDNSENLYNWYCMCEYPFGEE